MKRLILITIVSAALSGCVTFTAPRYGINAETDAALKSIGIAGVSIGQISDPATFNATCRGASPIHMPDGMTVGQYIQKALSDEMEIAGVASNSPRVTLTGTVDTAAFSSAWPGNSSWDLGMTLVSSNGKRVSTAIHYDFSSSPLGDLACTDVANALMPAVQNLIQKIVQSPDFAALVK